MRLSAPSSSRTLEVMRDLGAELLALGLEDAQAQLVGGGVDVGDEAPAQAGADALLQAG
jgi:hypothetical protein